jgi:hypothetical protein
VTEPSEHRARWLLVVAAVVALATLGVVLRFGLVGPPELDAVDATTAPEYSLAILSYRDSERGQCLDVIDPDGSVRELQCRLDGLGPLLGWDERGILVLRFTAFGERLEIIDPLDGRTLDRVDLDMRLVAGGHLDTVVDVERSGGTLTVRGEDLAVLWSVTAPDSYRISASVRQPETGDIAMLDTAGRMLLLRPDDVEPRVWAQGLDRSYGEIVWQGTPLVAE